MDNHLLNKNMIEGQIKPIGGMQNNILEAFDSIDRDDFYEKELTFQVSCSYGPGRYDPEYEVKGVDYPIGFVRWTEQRNLEAFLEFISQGYVKIDPLVTQRFPIADALGVYDQLLQPASSGVIGVVLTYQETLESNKNQVVVAMVAKKRGTVKHTAIQVGVIGAGLFAKSLLLTSIGLIG